MLSRLVYGPDGVVSSRLIVQGPFDGSQAEDESDRLLVYGTGGVAFGARRDFGDTFIGTTFGRPAFFTTASVSNAAVGYTVGAGLEYAFLDNWSIKAEYLFADLGRNRRTFVSPFTGAGVIIDARREQSHIVRVGLNYRFNWGGYGAAAPVVARY